METLVLPWDCSPAASRYGVSGQLGGRLVSRVPSSVAVRPGTSERLHNCMPAFVLHQLSCQFLSQSAFTLRPNFLRSSPVYARAAVSTGKDPKTKKNGGLESSTKGAVVLPHPESPAGRATDTAGAVLVVEELTLSAGGLDLLTGATWRLLPGQHTGLVGTNGCGKSTLLRALVGQADVQSGVIALAPSTSVAYLEQTAVSGSTRTVWDEARSRMVALNAALQELEAAETAVERGVEGAIVRLANAQEKVEAMDGYRADEIIAGVLNGLGFQQSDWTRSCMDFSGGWQMRIALARLLLEERSHLGESLLLLDEPTNHLDTRAKEWLGRYLRGVTAAVVVVSHEQDFVEKVCSHIAEIQGGQLHHYVGNYSSFLRARAARQLQASQAYKAKQAEIERLQSFVDRFGAKATKASAANSRKKQIERIKEEMPEVAPTEDLGASGGDKRSVKMKLPRPPPCAREVLLLRKAQIGWDTSASLLHDVDMRLEKGMRLVILGPNGCGKSTLMRAMAGRGGLLAGVREVGMGVEIGVFTQDLAQDLPTHISGLEFVLQVARETDASITDEQARTALGSLGLSGDAALRPIRALSGGEKARVALGVFILRPYNCLMLDEASNHLDRPSAMALAQSLSTFQGAMVAISHDIQFCQAIKPTHVARVGPDGSVTVSLCIDSDLGTEGQGISAATKKKPSNDKPGLQVGLAKERKRAAIAVADAPVLEAPKRKQQIQAQIKKNLVLIEKAETVLQMLDKEMMEAGSNAEKALDVHIRKQAIEKRKTELERQWESLEEEYQQIPA